VDIEVEKIQKLLREVECFLSVHDLPPWFDFLARARGAASFLHP
jgi:hypothetical protein